MTTNFRGMGVTRPLVLWTAHDIDQPAARGLRDGTARFLLDKIVFVINCYDVLHNNSNLQANRYLT
jgi:hypothetical protein